MKRSAIQNALLLGYPVLFLNFGPSFHRAPIFGLHRHDLDVEVQHTVCSCGRDHGPSKPADSDTTGESVDLQACDCLLCRFFKCYNVTAELDSFDLILSKSSDKTYLSFPQGLFIAMAPSARGPPTAGHAFVRVLPGTIRQFGPARCASGFVAGFFSALVIGTVINAALLRDCFHISLSSTNRN